MNELTQLYSRIQACPISDSCLKSCRKKDPRVSLKPQLNVWVGKDYHSGRILISGINRNLGGQYAHLDHEINDWVKAIIQELKEFRGGKAGKHHWLSHIKGIVERFLGKVMKDDKEAFDHICYTESVKCSPDWPLSLPTNAMNKNCMNQMGYLRQEIRILKPRLVVGLGGGNGRLIQEMYQTNGKRLQD